MDIKGEIEKAVLKGIANGVESVLSRSYDNPLQKVFADALGRQAGEYRSILESALAEAAADPAFVGEIKSAIRTAMAKQLVQKFGGELEKQVNALKSDPVTRARITLALEEIVKGRSPGG